MRPIRLVTFDVFGTLLDWQSYVEQAFPHRYDAFLAASAPKQVPGGAIFPYRDLLYDVALDLAPKASREALSFFAEGLGFARPFADSRAVQYLASMAMVGCASNCDLKHLLDVQRTLGLALDVTIAAEEMRAYKPHAWDAIVDIVTRKLGFDRQEWLHVSAYVDFDLIPAKERGVRTCFVPRPGGSSAALAAQMEPEMICSDLWQLADQIAAAQGAPVRYVVRATTRTPDLAHEFVHWMRYEHGPELLAVRSCQKYEVLRQSPTEIQCEYVFTNKAALEQYFNGPALRLREKSRARFAEGDVSFTRSDAEVLTGFSQRSRYDFQSPRL